MIDIETDRCKIERFSSACIPEAVELFTSPVVREYLGGPIPAEHALRRLEGWCRTEDPCFAVFRKTDGAFMGMVDLTPYHEPDKTELSYLFLPAYWGQGYAEESIRRILEYCRETLHMDFVVSETQKKNLRSCKLLERLNYTLEKKVERFGAEQCVYIRIL